jgi:hypothetical protein
MLHGPVYGAATIGCNGAPPTASSGSVNEAVPSSIHLSLSEIAQRRKDGKCFKCDELFTPGYRQHCKHPLVIEVVDDDEADNSTPTDGEPMISLHVLIGIQLRTGHTMQITVTGLLVLLDTGSTHNFIDTDKAAKVGAVLTGTGGLRMAVANGDRLASADTSRGVRIPYPVHTGYGYGLDTPGICIRSYYLNMDMGVAGYVYPVRLG